MNLRTALLLPLLAALVAGVTAAVVTLWWSGQDGDRRASVEVGTVLPEARPLPPVTLTADNGATWTTADFEGNWQFVFFGFTHCPDVCPMTLADLAGTLQRLEDADTRPLPEVVFVSVDPGRDTPDILETYVGHFHDAFVGVTGEREAIDTLTASLGISYTLHEPDAQGDYAVDHSAAILLIDPQGALRAVWSPPHGRQVLADEFRAIRARFSESGG
ncbi:MAG: SCO family protein [Spiribacter sp.]|nr:SCO family protein [Spiribacter sp.]